MGNAPKITKITLDKVQYDIDLPSDASPIIDSLEVTRQLLVPEIDDSKADNEAANKGYVDTKDAYLQEQINTIEARTDVVDVVGTKAELLAYDTSKLTEDDVIKVLADESLNNAITYYRWKASSWLLIGQIGPYVLIKTDTGNKVYVHNDATQTDLTYTKDATANTIVERTTNGNINLPSDTSKINNDSYATSKKYVDNTVKEVNDDLTEHINDKNNPHAVNKSQVGLSNVVNTGDSDTPVSGGTTKFTTGGAYTELNKKLNKDNFGWAIANRTYESGTTYNKGAIVYYEGYFYECIVDSTTAAPTDNTAWNNVKIEALIDRKVAKSNKSSIFYGRSASGEEAQIYYSSDHNNKSWQAVIRDGNSDVLVPATPTTDNAATSKKYVDNGLETKSNATNFENGSGTNAVQEKMADATVNFTGRNPNAEAIDSTISTTINTGASSSQSSAFGKNTMALATASFTNGNKTLAKGEESHAEGYQSVTLGDGSHAEGARTTAVGLQSHSEGADTIAKGEASHSEGHSTTADNYYAHAEGEDTIASGRASHAEGEASKATALSSHSEGSNNYIGEKPQDGPSGGGEVTPSQPSGYDFAAGESSHAEGFDNFVYGAGSHAEGAQNVINGTMSHAEGVKNTIGNTDGAHAEGYKTTVTGAYAHAEGQLTQAEGYASHAEGTSTRAHGTCSHAEGSTTTAYANFSHTMGTGTYAGNESMLAIGKYNSNNLNTLFVVGNGTADNTRSNAFEVYENGHAEIGLMGSTTNSVATKGYVDTKVTANTAITGATKCKITYDSKGLVTNGANLAASDIPNLDTSKITSGTFADTRIASASAWNAKYDKPSTGIPASDLAESYVTVNTDQDYISGRKTFTKAVTVKDSNGSDYPYTLYEAERIFIYPKENGWWAGFGFDKYEVSSPKPTIYINNATDEGGYRINIPFENGTLATQETVNKHQRTTTVVQNATHNINGYALSSYSATLTTAGGYTYYHITRNDHECSVDDVANYMARMTGSYFVPTYDEDYPRDCILIFSDGSMWKPQYNNEVFNLYRLQDSYTNTFVMRNPTITGATKCKITYDAKGLVTAGADLAASDIPSLNASKITSGTFADDRIASASTWNAKYTKPSGGIPNTDIAPSSTNGQVLSTVNGATVWTNISGTGTVTQITAGTGLTTTAGSSTDGGSITGNGTLYLTKTGIADGTYIKVDVDEYGRVNYGEGLLASDIPNLSASKITSGTFADSRIASASTWNSKIAALEDKVAILEALIGTGKSVTLTVKAVEDSIYAQTGYYDLTFSYKDGTTSSHTLGVPQSSQDILSITKTNVLKFTVRPHLTDNNSPASSNMTGKVSYGGTITDVPGVILGYYTSTREFIPTEDVSVTMEWEI